MDFILEVRRMSGAKILWVLNPSSTERSMKSVARVCQSMEERSSLLGGVMKREISATASDTVSMGSFFRNDVTLFIFFLGESFY